MPRHKVFISYHDGHNQPHSGGDWEWRQKFEKLFAHHTPVINSGAVRDGDIDPGADPEVVRQTIRDRYLFDSSVTVVLVGERTWQRMHVDWEISASVRDTGHSPRSGLLGIILPSHPDYRKPSGYRRQTIPPRLMDNVDAKFAAMHWWTENAEEVEAMVHAAYQRKATVQPVNTRPLYTGNLSGPTVPG